MNISKEDKLKLKQSLKRHLYLTNRARFHFRIIFSKEYPVANDLTIEDGDRKIFVDLSNKTSWDDLSKLSLLRDLDNEKSEFLIAGRLIPDSIIRAADEIDIKYFHIPEDISVNDRSKRPRGKITSEKSWKVIMDLIRNGPCSMRSISMREGVSYGWVHNVIGNLRERNILEKKENRVLIGDMDGLLNAVAWERPIEGLKDYTITTPFESTHDLSRTLTNWAGRKKTDIVMAVYIAATLHFGHGLRSDMVHCYIDDEKIRRTVKDEFSDENENGVKLVVLKPDRDISDDSVEIDSIRITSKEQTILDLGGLGYQARDLLDKVIK